MVSGSGVGGPITLFVACQLNGGVPTEGRFAGLGLPSLPATREVNLHWTFPLFLARRRLPVIRRFGRGLFTCAMQIIPYHVDFFFFFFFSVPKIIWYRLFQGDSV